MAATTFRFRVAAECARVCPYALYRHEEGDDAVARNRQSCMALRMNILRNSNGSLCYPKCLYAADLSTQLSPDSVPTRPTRG